MSGEGTVRTIPVSELNPELQRVYGDQDTAHQLRQQRLSDGQSQGSGEQAGVAQAISALNQVATTITTTVATAEQQANARAQQQAQAQQQASQSQEESREGNVMLRLLEQNQEADRRIMSGTARGAPRGRFYA